MKPLLSILLLGLLISCSVSKKENNKQPKELVLSTDTLDYLIETISLLYDSTKHWTKEYTKTPLYDYIQNKYSEHTFNKPQKSLKFQIRLSDSVIFELYNKREDHEYDYKGHNYIPLETEINDSIALHSFFSTSHGIIDSITFSFFGFKNNRIDTMSQNYRMKERFMTYPFDKNLDSVLMIQRIYPHHQNIPLNDKIIIYRNF